MNTQWRKFAPFGLYLALTALAVSVGLYIVRRTFDLPLQIALGLVVLGLAAFVLLDPQKTRELLSGRQARYGSNALLMALAFIGILVVVNVLVFNNSKSWDLTEDKQHTLSKETLETLEKLPEPVVVQAFFSSRYPYSTEQTSTLLNSYADNSAGKLTFEFIDPEANPIAAQNAQITRDGTLVFRMGDRSEQVTYADETEMTSALIRLANPGDRAVYFLTGHGESPLEPAGEMSLSQLKTVLESKNYTVKSLDLLSNPSIPEDALTIIVAGGLKPISDQERDLLKAYLESGKSLVVLSEPPAVSGTEGTGSPLETYLTDSWGITLDNDVVIDPNVNPPLIAVSDTASYGSHPVTERLQGMATIFPTSRSISLQAELPENISHTPLVVTSQNAWGETDIASIESNQVTVDAASDYVGPVTLAVAAQNTATQARLVVVGDSDFLNDTYFANYGNGDLIVNVIDWAAAQENLLNLTPKQTTERVLLTPENYQIGLMFLILVLVMPLAVVALGVTVWIQRKHRM